MQRGVVVILALILYLITMLIIASESHPADRCSSLVNQVRIEHTKYFGLGFPYWYGVGQLKTESACKTTISAFDGGMGVAQFMPRTSTYIQSLMGEVLDPYNPQHAIRMQAYYMARIQQKENWDKALWVSYQIYNGGKSTLYKEYQRAGITDWNLMRLKCQRKKLQMKWGILDFCEVNYSYSKHVEQHGNLYRRGFDGMRYW